MKSITLRRRELVWYVYEVTYTEADWETLLSWLSTQNDEYNQTRYQALKNVSFKQVCAILNGDEEDIYWDISTTNVSGHSFIYDESLTEFLKENMREDAWDRGAIYSDSADDSDEEFFVNPTKYYA